MRRITGCLVAALSLAAVVPAHAQYSDAQITDGLMANAWCSFSYNQTSGYSRSRRGVFRADGSLSVSNNAEGGSSGSAGSYYGQSAGGDVYGWKVEGGVLYLMEDGAWSGHELDARQSANGTIILLVDGVEWSAC